MKAILSVLFLFIFSHVFSQSYMGLYATDNSILQVRENPAFTINDDVLQLNFLSVGITVGGNSFYFKKSIFNFAGDDKATIDQDYSKNYFPGLKSFWAFGEVKGPGASFHVKIKEKRYFFSVTSGTRYLVNSDNLNNKIFNLLGENAQRDPSLYDTLKVSNYSIASQVFSEVNLSYAGYFYQSEYYNLVAGVTLKLLDGIGAAAVNIPNAIFETYNNDSYAYNFTGKGTIAFTPYAHDWAITNKPYNAFNEPTNNVGAGLDMGLIYYMNPNERMQLKRGYLVRFAASVTDIGSINYSASNTSGNYYVNNKNINYHNIHNEKDISFGNKLFNDYMVDTVLRPSGVISNFNMKLPTALHLDADLRIVDDFFFNFNILLNLVKPSMSNFSNHYITTFTLTPRYIHNVIGLAAPFTYNIKGQGYLGLIVYLGPLFIGSGSAWQMAISNSFSNVSIFTGANFRIKPKETREKVLLWDN